MKMGYKNASKSYFPYALHSVYVRMSLKTHPPATFSHRNAGKAPCLQLDVRYPPFVTIVLKSFIVFSFGFYKYSNGR